MTIEVEVAQWGELTYFLYQIPSTNQFEVAVVDRNNNRSVFNFETGHQIGGSLSVGNRRVAQEMIQGFHEEFLDHWNKVMKNAR